MTLTITLVGASIFVLQEVLKEKGYSQLSKSLYPISAGLSGIWIIKHFTELL